MISALLVMTVIAAGEPADFRPLDDAELRSRIAAVDKELAAEKAIAADAKARWESQLKEKLGQRSALAQQAFDLEAERQTLDKRRAELTARERKLQTDAAALQVSVDGLRSSAVAMAEQLIVHLSEIPGGEEQAKSAEGLAQDLRDRNIGPGFHDALRVLPVLVDRVHGEASNVTLRTATIWDESGKPREVQLLSAGHIAYMYQAKEGGEIAIALRSPADAAGYRWSTQAPEAVKSQVRAAIASGGGLLPIDVTGKLRAESLASHEGWADVVRSGGPVMIPIFGVGGLAILMILERLWTLYGRNATRPALVRRVFEAARAGNYEEAEQLAAQGGGTVLRVLAACLRRRAAGQHAMEDTVQEQLLAELPRLQRSLSGLSVLAAVSPLLGLLGTVTGIIQTFAVVKTFGNSNPGYMAGGISEALVCTAAGLIVAIPTLLVASMLRGRVERIMGEAEKNGAALLNSLAHDRKAVAP